MLPQKAVEEFKKIYKKSYGVELSDEEATDKANRLVNLYKAVYSDEVWALPKDHEKMKKMDNQKLNCIVIHGCPSDEEKAMDPERRTYDKHWIPWVKKNLTALGIKTETPLMPNPWTPDYDSFKREFENLEVSENTILIGHSCGCAFLV